MKSRRDFSPISHFQSVILRCQYGKNSVQICPCRADSPIFKPNHRRQTELYRNIFMKECSASDAFLQKFIALLVVYDVTFVVWWTCSINSLFYRIEILNIVENYSASKIKLFKLRKNCLEIRSQLSRNEQEKTRMCSQNFNFLLTFPTFTYTLTSDKNLFLASNLSNSSITVRSPTEKASNIERTTKCTEFNLLPMSAPKQKHEQGIAYQPPTGIKPDKSAKHNKSNNAPPATPTSAAPT